MLSLWVVDRHVLHGIGQVLVSFFLLLLPPILLFLCFLRHLLINGSGLDELNDLCQTWRADKWRKNIYFNHKGFPYDFKNNQKPDRKTVKKQKPYWSSRFITAMCYICDHPSWMWKHWAKLTRRHEVPELLWNNDALFGLVILQNGTHNTCGGTHGCVQHVDKLCLHSTERERERVLLMESAVQQQPGMCYWTDLCWDAQLQRRKETHLVHHLFGLAIADAEAPGLVVGAVWAGDQLSESTRAWEPGLQVQLLTGSMI